MLEKILVALDGSPHSEAVLPEVRRFLRMEDSELLLVRVAQAAAVEPFPGLFEAALTEARVYLSRMERRLADQGVRVRSATEIGRPADVLLRIAREEGASLIALTTRGRSGIGRALLGSVAEEVLRLSPVPVLVVRAEPRVPETTGEARPIREILVPLDGSERSRRALPPAIDLARLYGSRILLLYVRGREEPPERLSPPPDPLARAAEAVESAGISAVCLVQKGDPATAILNAARIHAADLVVMGTHGRSGLKRLMAGSVTESVLRQSPVPLLVVRTAEESERKATA